MKSFILPTGKKQNGLIQSVTTDCESFYNQALQFTVTRNMLSDLEVLYWKKVPKDHVEFDPINRKWVEQEPQIMLVGIQPQEIHSPKTFGAKVKGLFSWFKKEEDINRGIESTKITPFQAKTPILRSIPPVKTNEYKVRLNTEDDNEDKNGTQKLKKQLVLDNQSLSIMSSSCSSASNSVRGPSHNMKIVMGSGILRPK